MRTVDMFGYLLRRRLGLWVETCPLKASRTSSLLRVFLRSSRTWRHVSRSLDVLTIEKY